MQVQDKSLWHSPGTAPHHATQTRRREHCAVLFQWSSGPLLAHPSGHSGCHPSTRHLCFEGDIHSSFDEASHVCVPDLLLQQCAVQAGRMVAAAAAPGRRNERKGTRRELA